MSLSTTLFKYQGGSEIKVKRLFLRTYLFMSHNYTVWNNIQESLFHIPHFSTKHIKTFVPAKWKHFNSCCVDIRVLFNKPIGDSILKLSVRFEALPPNFMFQEPEKIVIIWCEIRTACQIGRSFTSVPGNCSECPMGSGRTSMIVLENSAISQWSLPFTVYCFPELLQSRTGCCVWLHKVAEQKSITVPEHRSAKVSKRPSWMTALNIFDCGGDVFFHVVDALFDSGVKW